MNEKGATLASRPSLVMQNGFDRQPSPCRMIAGIGMIDGD
jgi:hypothetical protein